MVTIKDISKKSGYSTTTVSKSLNDYTEIPKITRDKIKHIASELGYVPNYSAKSLKTNKSWTIGVIFDEISGVGLQHPLFSKILEAFRKEVEKIGYDVLLISRSLGGEKVSYYVHSMMKSVEAVFVLCAPFNSVDIQKIFSSDIPNVVIDYISENTTTITSSTRNSLTELIQHLKALGHTRIANIYGSEITYIGSERKKVFIDCMNNANLELPENYLVSGEFFSRDEGYYAMKQLLDLEKVPSAVFCASDMLAIGAIEAIQERSLNVPNDISVIGFDGIDMCQLFRPRLSTIKQDTEAMGKLGAKLILDMINSNKKTKVPKVLSVDSIYLRRDSTARFKK